MYYFDSHCDYLWKKLNNGTTELTAEKAKKASIKKSVLAVFEGSEHKKADIVGQLRLFDSENPVEEKYLAFEGLSWIESLKDTEVITANKPVYASPVWNIKNSLGGSCKDDGEITDFGKCIVRELSENGIYTDLSHAGENMFYSVLDVTDKVIVSHGNVFDIKEHRRNFKKYQIKALIERNSYLGLTFYTEFVGGDSISKLLEHIEYVLDMGGENVLGFGSDIDGCDSTVSGGLEAFDMICEEMLRRNYPHKLTEAICHGNFERILCSADN